MNEIDSGLPPFELDNSKVKKALVLGSAVALTATPSLEVIAQDQEAEEEIIVTASKRVSKIEDLIKQYSKADEHAHSLELGVNAGHDLNLSNLSIFLSECNIDEVSIGHALVTDSLKFGMRNTVKKYLHLCK